MDSGIRQWTSRLWLEPSSALDMSSASGDSKFSPHRASLLLAAAVVLWFVASLLMSRTRVVVDSLELHLGLEAASAFARLFSALVLVLIAAGPSGASLRWMAVGFGILAISGLLFGFVPSLRGEPLSFSSSMYLSKLLWASAGVMMLVGLLPRRPPTLSRKLALALILLVSVGPAVVAATSISLPSLIVQPDIQAEIDRNKAILDGMSAWHWIVAVPTLAIAITAAVAAAAPRSRQLLGGWLLVAIILFAGAQLHDIRFPSSYGPIVTTADLLELASAGIICVAGILELKRFGTEHAKLLDLERESSHNLRQLSILKSDFTAMIAHELGNPLAAIRRQADLLGYGQDEPQIRAQSLAAIQAEVQLLSQLVLDVQESAQVERDEFDVVPRPYPIDGLLTDAAAFGRALPGHHPIIVNVLPGRVLVDPDRIGQVLRNLIDNAAKYSDVGEPIELRARRVGQRVYFDVCDRGPGLEPVNQARVFEKFERGPAAKTGKQHGLGLGLYLAQRIVTLHGGLLTVDSTSTSGSIFTFDVGAAI